MPPPRYDRQASEDELQDLRALLAHLRHELAATPDENRELREMLAVKIKLVGFAAHHVARTTGKR